jgi:hypothetical protein
MIRKILSPTISKKVAHLSNKSWNSIREFLIAFNYAQELWTFSLVIKSSALKPF